MKTLPACARAVLPILFASSLALGAASTNAALLAYEGFDYVAVGADVLGQSGGAGFTSPWMPGGFNATSNTNYDVGSGSLAFQSLLTSGNRAFSNPVNSAIAGLTRNLGTPLGTAGTTRYVSFLLRPEGTLNQGLFNGFFGLLLEQPSEPELFIGKPGGGIGLEQYVLEDRGGSGQVATGFNAVVGEAAFLVLKAQFTAGIDTFTLYLNPMPGGLEPLTGTVKNNTNTGLASGLTIYSTGAFSIDEIRVGETFADVTPFARVPEPASWMLLLAGMGLLLTLGRDRGSLLRA